MADMRSYLSFLILCLFLRSSLTAKEPERPEYLRYVKEIISNFASDMEKEYEIHCCGSGGSMPHDVEKIEVLFSSDRKLTVEEARRIEVNGINKLLFHINNHEKIRPYLKEYPFNTNRIGLSISVQTETGNRPLDGSIAYVFLSKNRIFYDIAKIIVDEPTPLIYMNDKNEVVRKMIGGGPKEKLVSFLDESYDEAVVLLNRDSKQ